jgi:hypothetical protein
MQISDFHPPLDPGIECQVVALRAAGIETFESCEGGHGHAYPEPTVRFHGDQSEGFRALAAALKSGLKVAAIRRAWPVIESEPTGPWWEMTFHPHQG